MAAPGLLVVRPVSGLCNRLGVISSYEILARRTGRELRVCWAPSIGWSEETLGDLFDNRFTEVTETDFEDLRRAALCLDKAVAMAGIGGVDRTLTWAPGTSLRQVFDTERFPVVTYRGSQRCDWLVTPLARATMLPRFMADYGRAVRTWRPVAALRHIVDSVAVEFRGLTVGVHIRRGDALLGSSAGAYRRSSDDAFQSRMDRLIRSQPGIQFFLATDSEQTERRFRDRYGDALLTHGDKRFVLSIPGYAKANQRDAVIDLFALARTRLVLGTNYSSFSQMAALMGDIKMERVMDRSWAERLLIDPYVAVRSRSRQLGITRRIS
jgi:hypothetical protein